MANKPNVRTDIKDASAALKEVMHENLALIAGNMVAQVMRNWRNLTDSKRFDAIKDVKPQGEMAYKEKLLNALAVIASVAIEKARKEVPKKKNVKLAELDESALQLGEFDKLPADLKKRVEATMKLLVGTQISDLEKIIFFQFNSSVDSTDSESQLKDDLEESAGDFIGGSSINGGAGAVSAQIINEARLAFFLDDEVSQEVEAFEFVNGDPVSDICTDLAGTIFSKDDPNLNRYWPPLHFNCKSYISPILVGNLGNKEITELKPSKAKLEDAIQFSEIALDFAIKEAAQSRDKAK